MSNKNKPEAAPTAGANAETENPQAQNAPGGAPPAAPETTQPPTTTPPAEAKHVEVRLLLDCVHGKINAVVKVPAAEAKRAAAEGWGDPSPAAVAYAKTLSKPDKG